MVNVLMQEVMMKKIVLFMISIAMLAACTPYKNLQDMKNMRTDLKYPYEIKYAPVNDDIELAYVDEGEGEHTIVFIHGLGSYLPAWKKNIEVLKNDYRCIAVDLPGYGKSTKNPHSGMMTFYADVMAQFLDYLEIDKAVFAGHSMGGQISMVMALEHPGKVEKLVLVSPAGFERFTEGQKDWFRDVMTLKGVKLTTVDAIETNLAYNFYNLPDDAQFMITDRIAMRHADDFDNYCYDVVRSVHGMVDQPVIDKLDQIKQPVLILFGENDNLIPNRYLNPGKTYDVAIVGDEKIPDSKLVMVPKCGHFLQFEKPEVLNSEIKAFVR